MTEPKGERLVFFGNERLATGVQTDAPVLRGLLANGYHIIAVVMNAHPSHSRQKRTEAVAGVAREHDIPVLTPQRPLDILDELRAMHAKAGILVAYGRIVPQAIIDMFPVGIINIHPSLLPQHRGPVPIEQVILDGAHQTGVSIMQLAKAMDAGPVYAQQPIPLTGREAKQDLADTCAALGRDLVLQNLPAILAGTLQPTKQDEATATYDRLLAKSDGLIDWIKPAAALERQVRALLGWPGSKTMLCGRDVAITKAHAGDSQPFLGTSQTGGQPGTPFVTKHGELAVVTGHGELIIDRLVPAGRSEMDGRSFLAGNPLS